MDLKRAAQALKYFMDHDIPAFMWGPPGVGKSDIIRQVATEESLPWIDFRAILRDPVDLRGLPAIIDGEARWLPPSDLPNELKHGKKGILFLDELNAAPPSVQAACFGLVLDRKVGEYTLPAGWRIVAAGNRQGDKAAAHRMPTALANRFAHIDVDVSIEAFNDWARTVQLNAMVLAFLRFRPNLLHNMAGSELRAFPTPRSWAQVAKIADAPAEIRLGLVQGLVGESAAGEFESFIRTFLSLPKMSDILSKPRETAVPMDMSAKYAIATALPRHLNAGNFANACTYMERLPKEMEILFMMDVIAADKTLGKTPTFVQWSIKNQDVIMN